MKITLAINTYNRKDILEKSICSLKKVKYLDQVNVRVYDDKSTDYNYDFLRKLIPFAKTIIVRKQNLKADKNMYMMYKEFLLTEDEYLIQIDSDMIYNENFILKSKEVCNELNTKEFVASLYNSNLHKSNMSKEKLIAKTVFKEKKTIGGACVLFSRKTIEKILENIVIKNDDFKNYDYRWSNYLIKNKIKIFVSEESYVQHIGFEGQNTRGVSYFDLGKNFKATNFDDSNFLLKFYEEIISSQKEYYENQGLKFFIKKFIKRNIIDIKGFLLKG